MSCSVYAPKPRDITQKVRKSGDSEYLLQINCTLRAKRNYCLACQKFYYRDTLYQSVRLKKLEYHRIKYLQCLILDDKLWLWSRWLINKRVGLSQQLKLFEVYHSNRIMH